MANSLESMAAARVKAGLDLVRQRSAPERRDAVLRFAQAYLEGLDAADLVERELSDLCGAVLSLWQFAKSRRVGAPKLRVFNPVVDERGWQSPHTVIQVVNDDMPFLVDSMQMEIHRHGLTLHFIAHPIVSVRRDGNDELVDVVERGSAGKAIPESLMHIEVDRIVDGALRKELAADIERVLSQVRIAVADWKPMRRKMAEVSAGLATSPPPLPAMDIAETKAFLDWLGDDHFTFIGYRNHDLVEAADGAGLAIVKGSGLGVLHESGDQKLSTSFMHLPARLRAHAKERNLLIITKSNQRSTVHRPGFLDYIGIKRYDPSGNVCGEHRFLGLYTSAAYSAKPADIPLLRLKVGRIIDGAGFPRESHARKSLGNILDTYPRDELFQIDDAALLETALAIQKLEGRQRLRLFLRDDLYERFVSCLIYAPRERYTTELRRRWQAILMEAFKGSGSEFAVLLSESALARVLITVRTRSGHLPRHDVRELEKRLADAARRWEDDVQHALDRALGEGRASPLVRRYANAFPAAYREDFAAQAAVGDIELVERALETGGAAINLYRPADAPPDGVRFKLAHRGGPVPLSNALPMLERMGLTVIEERPYRISPEGKERVWLHDYGLIAPGADVDVDEVRELFEQTFARVFTGELESDDFNRLALLARLAPDEIVVLRLYGRYLRQIGFPLSQAFIEQTLAAHPAIARMLVSLFRIRFDPERPPDDAEARQVTAIESALDKVDSLNEDRVLRQYVAMILATTRTNFWRTGKDGKRRSYLSVKFDPAKVPGLPEPKPMFEIFVYSARFEGVHLRGGKVARGGLRWSDRPEDFRTEVLGLVKAQVVKNVVIVPTGSKGGFVLKRAPPPSEREAYLKEGIACYQDYLRGLLDLTDNLEGEAVVPPPQLRRHDPDDPYLVVAADKGTASFSDYANAVSAEYGFWLGDAFASGGSVGYDHKKMGITARGAWEAAKRHFRELGVDTQATDFTVAGIGDMSGDVFGNGMLQSKHIRLVAAFDHRHVFIDPDPDPATSHEERARLFALPRSSWADYDERRISGGGGVWPRSAKSIPVSPAARKVLGVDAEQLPPSELISAILKAPVDLLYNGGIGTYVKAATESHGQAGDRANDAVRVNGRELRCRVVVEGGNLGLTQLGRVEFAAGGGRINTDAIDNSGGVDTSDHEVNIKILLGLAVAEGSLTVKQRNDLLASMTEDVAGLVLRDNYEQTQLISVGGHIASTQLEHHARLIRHLEREGRLNRELEFLPGDEEIAKRAAVGRGLTAPERAVLLAYAKIWLTDAVERSSLPDDSWVGRVLAEYFPPGLRKSFASHLPHHPLRRDIVATVVVNQAVNRVGPAFVNRLRESTGADPADVVRAQLLAREVFALPALWAAIEALDGKIADHVQAGMLIEVGRLNLRATGWFLKSERLHEDMGATIARFAPGVEAISARIFELVQGSARDEVYAQAGSLEANQVPRELARRVATIEALFGALDIVETAVGSKQAVIEAAAVYYDLGARLFLDWLAQRIAALTAEGHWQTLAKQALRDDLAELQRVLTRDVFALPAAHGDAAAAILAWETRHPAARERAMRVVEEVRAAPSADLAMLSVALRELRNLGEAARG